MKDDVATEENVAEEATEAQAGVQLSIGDLANMRQILDVATQRGAFKADELAVVGSTYNRLNAFLAGVLAQVNATAEGEAEDSTEE